MENSLKQEFTRRLSQCNSGEMIIIMYDIVFAYMEEAKEAYESGAYHSYKAAIRKSQGGIDTLMGALNFKYDMAKDLHKLYQYCKVCLERGIYQNRMEGLSEAEKILRRLYASFLQAAKADTSGPLMANTQQVYAGMTYGRTSLNENYIEDYHRGFFA